MHVPQFGALQGAFKRVAAVVARRTLNLYANTYASNRRCRTALKSRTPRALNTSATRQYVSSTRAMAGSCSEIRSAAAGQFRRVPLDPAPDRHVIHAKIAFGHDLFQLPQAERIPKVPAHAQHDDLRLEVSSLEQRRPLPFHAGRSLSVATQRLSLIAQAG